jgi:hypothetical protein
LPGAKSEQRKAAEKPEFPVAAKKSELLQPVEKP